MTTNFTKGIDCYKYKNK